MRVDFCSLKPLSVFKTSINSFRQFIWCNKTTFPAKNNWYVNRWDLNKFTDLSVCVQLKNKSALEFELDGLFEPWHLDKIVVCFIENFPGSGFHNL